jgi:predicted transcriptional regulator
MDWDKFGFIKASDYRRKVLISLSNSPKTPTEISESTDIHRSHVSNTLNELSKKELVEVLNPDATKGRLYSLTKEGEAFTEKLD